MEGKANTGPSQGVILFRDILDCVWPLSTSSTVSLSQKLSVVLLPSFYCLSFMFCFCELQHCGVSAFTSSALFFCSTPWAHLPLPNVRGLTGRHWSWAIYLSYSKGNIPLLLACPSHFMQTLKGHSTRFIHESQFTCHGECYSAFWKCVMSFVALGEAFQRLRQ